MDRKPAISSARYPTLQIHGVEPAMLVLHNVVGFLEVATQERLQNINQ